MFIWNASIIGPDESPWEGGIYALRITFPDQYVTSRRRVGERACVCVCCVMRSGTCEAGEG